MSAREDAEKLKPLCTVGMQKGPSLYGKQHIVFHTGCAILPHQTNMVVFKKIKNRMTI